MGNYSVALSGSGIGGAGALLNGGTNAASLSGQVALNGNSAIGVTNAGASLTLSGLIKGSANLTTAGAGTLVLADASNTFGGAGDAINLNGGTLSVGADGDLGNAANTLNFNGGALSTTANFSSNRTMNLNATTNDIAVAGSTTLTSYGIISGTGGMALTGPGTLVLVNTGNTFGSAGSTIALNAGTLSVASDVALGNAANTLTFNGGALSTTFSIASSRGVILTATTSDIAVAGATTLTLSGTISGNGGLAATGPGTLALTNAGNTFGGAGITVALNAGTLSVGSDGALGNAANTLTFNGGMLSTTAGFASGRSVILNPATSDIAVAGSTVLTLSGTISGNGGLALTGLGTLALGNAGNTFGGAGTSIALNAGTLSVGSNGALGNTANTLIFNGGALQTTAGFASARGVSILAANAPIAPAAGTFLDLNGSVSGTGAVVMSGPGELVLGGNNTYSGGTVINSGTLDVYADANLGNASGGVTIGAAGTIEERIEFQHGQEYRSRWAGQRDLGRFRGYSDANRRGRRWRPVDIGTRHFGARWKQYL